MDAKIVEQSKEMEELQGQVDELLEYGRELKVAKEQGLELQKNNVKAVPKP